MKTQIEVAILVLLNKINQKTNFDEALRFTQAALNLAHVIVTLDSVKQK